MACKLMYGAACDQAKAAEARLAVAERVLRALCTVEWLTTDWRINGHTGRIECWHLGDECDPHWLPLDDVDPAAAAYLAALIPEAHQ